jgi:hypothetical protein
MEMFGPCPTLIIKGSGGLATAPSELMVFRWKSFEKCPFGYVFKIAETVYRGEIRPFGKTPESASGKNAESGVCIAWRCQLGVEL